ncbi:hypothetical protein C8J57DRAFT_1268805 [Mycena rebaudengoi]|nr:hypothetical protein C8J57DRAFT_1268805 [Mycena rebaudengoi]
MLKRVRPISPPPSSPSIPLVSDPSEFPGQEAKRRRILPPSLDGQFRGRNALSLDEDDGEEDEDEAFSDGRNASRAGPQPSSATVDNAEYQSANSFLHDLHALHRHRLIFSSPQSPQHPTYVIPHHYHEKHLPLTSEYARTPDDKDRVGLGGVAHFTTAEPSSLEEVQSVKERYEDTNKRLGSLFLSRRKQFDEH